MLHRPYQLPQDILTALDSFLGKTQGMVIEREAEKWAALAAGTSTNYVLKSGGAGANNSWGYAPGLAYIGNQTVSGSAVTTLTFSGLDLAVDGFYFFTLTILNTSASTSAYSLYVHGDTTATNYYTERAAMSGATFPAGNNNEAIFASITAGEKGTFIGFIHRPSADKPRIHFFGSQRDTTALQTNLGSIVWQSTTNPTSFTVSGSVASSVGIGTSWNFGRFHP